LQGRFVSSSLPPEIAVAELADGVHYRLPGRRWGLPALLGSGALVAGCLKFTLSRIRAKGGASDSQ